MGEHHYRQRRRQYSLEYRNQPLVAWRAKFQRRQAVASVLALSVRSRIQTMDLCVRNERGITMANRSNDRSVLGHIDRLVKEEERLYTLGELKDEDQRRLSELKVELDQCWDLLRQRRALREFGKNPDEAKVRSAEIVEDYEQ